MLYLNPKQSLTSEILHPPDASCPADQVVHACMMLCLAVRPAPLISFLTTSMAAPMAASDDSTTVSNLRRYVCRGQRSPTTCSNDKITASARALKKSHMLCSADGLLNFMHRDNAPKIEKCWVRAQTIRHPTLEPSERWSL